MRVKVFATALFIAIPQIAWAGPVPKPQYTPIFDTYGKGADVPLERAITDRFHRGVEADDFKSSLGLRWMQSSPGGSDPNGGSGAETAPTPIATALPRALSFKDNMSGYTDLHNDTKKTEISNNLVSSADATLKISRRLVDPGIAEGVQDSSQENSQFLGNTYSSIQETRASLAIDPQWGPEWSAVMEACVSKQMEQGASGSQGSGGNSQASWLAAVSRCVGFLDTSNTTGGQNNQQNGQNGNTTIGADGSTFSPKDNFIQDPNQQANGGNQNTTEARLSWYLFPGDANSNPELQEIRAAFTAFIGDVLITWEDVGGSQSGNQNQNGGGKSRSVKYSIVKVAPTDTERTPQQEFRRMWKDTYTNMMNLLKARCEYHQGGVSSPDKFRPYPGSDSSTTSGGGGCQHDGGPLYDFWKDCVTKEHIVALSYPGSPAGAAWMETVWSFYLAREGGVASSGGSSSSSGTKVNCAKFDPTGEFEFTKLEQDDSKAMGEIRWIYVLAKNIAVGKMIGSFLKIQEAIGRTTVGVINNPQIANAAYALLYEAAGTEDLFQAYNQNLDEFRRALQAMYRVASEYSGTGGGAMRGTTRRNE